MNNSFLKIMTIIGARPQFVKAASVSRALREYYVNAKEVIVNTGQHYDSNMSDIFFDELEIPRPDYNLGIGGGSHGQNTGRMIESVEAALVTESPDWVLVYGDTDSTLAGTLAAVKLHIPVAHIEAGLRSFNRRMPEEINRVLTDHASSLLFTPTDTATRNLANEGISGDRVKQFGDVMYDAALFYKCKAQKPPTLKFDGDFVLATIHRAENTDDPNKLAGIISALNEIAATKQVILPLHPRTKKVLALSCLKTQNITFIDPVGYLQMIWLLEHCSIVITDSGGLQKEAFFFGKACITTRDETEWVELVELGANILAGASADSINNGMLHFKNTCIKPNQVYGSGHASVAIVNSLMGSSY